MFPDLVQAQYDHDRLKPEPVKRPPIDPAEMAIPVEPVKMFDDLYMTGCRGNSIYVLKTEEGLVLFDSTEDPNAYERYLKPGLEKLGLAGEKVTTLFLTHGHYDHYLGADSIRRNTGCSVGLSEKDCAYMVWSYENIQSDGEFRGGAVPRISFLIRDNEVFIFGSHQVLAMIGGGHTPGCLNYSFEVHEGSETHRVLLCGGFIVFGFDAYMSNGGVYPYGTQWSVDEALNYASSSVRMWEYAKKEHCDVFLNPHPFACGLFDCVEKHRNRKPGDPNGFVIGTNGVRRFIADRFRTSIDSACRFTDIEKDYAE